MSDLSRHGDHYHRQGIVYSVRHLIVAVVAVTALFAVIAAPSAVAGTVSAAQEEPPPQIAEPVDQPPPAGDARVGYFGWTATLKYRLPSRIWRQNAGNTTIRSYMRCSGRYLIQLSGREPKWFTCNVWFVYTWRNVPAGYKQFVISKTNDGRYIKGYGGTYYP